MKPPSTSTPLALWLDPDMPMSSAQAAAISDAGWAFLGIETLEALKSHAAQADVVVVRVVQDVTRFKQVQQVLEQLNLTLPIVCRVERDQLELAVEAAQAGALGVIAHNDQNPQTWVQMQLKLLNPTPHAPSKAKAKNLVFVDPASQHLLALAQRVAAAEVTALLVGPTGSGKEVLAQVLHEYSSRAKGPFVAMNCAAMPEHLIEDLLFGHEKGAFTGAHKEHKGLFEQAQGGTLFLDEIGEMPLHLQSKLLRVLQEKQLTRLGGHHLLDLNVRIIAATNKDLKEAIEAKQFREDLYYRIATFRLRLMPLKDRMGDILPMALSCLQRHGKAGEVWTLSAEAQTLLLNHAWPGNVRELENVMRRAMVLCPDKTIGPEHLMFDDLAPQPTQTAQTCAESQHTPMTLVPMEPVTRPPAPIEVQDLHSATRVNEHQVIMATLAQTHNREEAARKLGISPRTLRYKLAQFKAMGMAA